MASRVDYYIYFEEYFKHFESEDMGGGCTTGWYEYKQCKCCSRHYHKERYQREYPGKIYLADTHLLVETQEEAEKLYEEWLKKYQEELSNYQWVSKGLQATPSSPPVVMSNVRLVMIKYEDDRRIETVLRKDFIA